MLGDLARGLPDAELVVDSISGSGDRLLLKKYVAYLVLCLSSSLLTVTSSPSSTADTAGNAGTKQSSDEYSTSMGSQKKLIWP